MERINRITAKARSQHPERYEPEKMSPVLANIKKLRDGLKAEDPVRSEPEETTPILSDPARAILKRITDHINNILAKIKAEQEVGSGADTRKKEIALKPVIVDFGDSRMNDALIALTLLGYDEKPVMRYLRMIVLMPGLTTKAIIRSGIKKL